MILKIAHFAKIFLSSAGLISLTIRKVCLKSKLGTSKGILFCSCLYQQFYMFSVF